MTHSRKAQAGIATLVIAMVLLIAATFIVFFGAKVGVQEQRSSANDYRYKQGFTTAEALLERAKVVLASDRSNFDSWPWTACTAGQTTLPCGNGTENIFDADFSWVDVSDLDPNAVLFFDEDGNPLDLWYADDRGPFILTEDTTNSFAPVVLAAPGRSDDKSGLALVRVSQTRFLIAQPGPVPPIMAPTVPLGGNFTVVGNPNHDLDPMAVTLANCDSLTGSGQMLSIWSADPLPSSGTWQTCGSGSYRDNISPTATRCVDPDEDVDDLTNSPPTWNQCRCQPSAAEKSPYSGNTEGINDDIVDDDPNFPEGVFAYVFGRTKDAVKASAASEGNILPNCDGLNEDSTGLYWVTGDCDLSNNQTIGSRAAPAIVVFEQDAHFQGTSRFWGLMVGADMERTCSGGTGDPYYVGGTCTSLSPNEADIQGTFTLHGAMIVEGEIDGTGTYNALYDPCVFAAMGAGTGFDKFGPVAGSWNDRL